MQGWIKIHRKITDHWLWTNPIAMWRWLDLLFQASWEDKKIYKDNRFVEIKKGSFIASADFLTERWACSKSTTKAFLDALETEKMIERSVPYPRVAVITICNYEKYQLTDEEVSTPNSTPNSTQTKNIKNIINNLSNNACVRTCEALFADTAWVELMCMQNHITPEQLTDYLKQFDTESKCKAVVHNGTADYKRHFFDWLRIALHYERKEKTNGNAKGTTTEEERHNAVINRAAELFARGAQVR